MGHGIPSGARSLYLLPIGGTLAAPLAGLLKEAGYEVSGTDTEVFGPMKELLARIGIEPLRGYDPAHLAPPPDLVLVGNAVPRTNPEVAAVLQGDLPYASMPEALGALILAGRQPIVVAGTHGKTTTTSLLAHTLHALGLDPGFLVGGLPIDFGQSFRLGRGAPFVVEGDEYNTAFFDRDAKFLHYAPRVAVVTHLEFDHGDIYPDIGAIEDQFARLLRLVPPASGGGLVVVCADAPRARDLVLAHRPDAITYGLRAPARLAATDLAGGPDGMSFRVTQDGAELGRATLRLWGEHNVGNALACLAVALALHQPFEGAAAALASFSGVRRRLEERGSPGGVTVVDDFAHHPTAVGETVRAARLRYPGRRLHVLFEPRSLTAGRTLFRDGYLVAFSQADRVSFAPIFHKGRLRDDERLDFDGLARELAEAGLPAIAYDTLEELERSAVGRARPGDVLLFMSSGSFSGAIDRVLAALGAGPERAP